MSRDRRPDADSDTIRESTFFGQVQLAEVGWPVYLMILVVVAAVYLATARLGLSLAFLHANVSPVWPPTGLAIAAILWFGYRIAPAILLGAFLVNLATDITVATAAGIAVGNTLEALSAAWLLHRFVGHHYPFNRARDVLIFILIAGIISPIVSATIGSTSLCLSGAAGWDDYGWLWSTWWLGDGSGALVVAPLILTWLEKPSQPLSMRQRLMAVLLFALLSSVSLIVFRDALLDGTANYPLGHLTIPFLLWAAFQFGPRGVATAIAVISGIAIWGTTRGFGPFVETDPNESLLLLQVFIVALATAALVLAALVAERKRAQNSATFLAAIVESTDDVVIGWGLDGRILSWNRSAERLYGYEAGEIIGHDISILFPAHRTEDFSLIVDRLKRGDRMENFETVHVRNSGEHIDVSLTISGIASTAGTIEGVSAIARDITTRRRAEDALRASEDRLRAIIDNIPAFIYLKDIRGKYMLMNRRGLIHLGLDWKQVHGRTDYDLYVKEVADSFAASDLRVLDTGGAIQLEEPREEPDGLHRYLTIKFPLFDSDGIAYAICGITTDVTKMKQAEDEREQLLVREQSARTEAEAANRAKDEFLAILSHELRAPLNAISGWVEILLDKGQGDELLSGHALETIKRNAALQSRIIEDILDVSRIVAGKLVLEMQPVDLSGIIQAGTASVQLAANDKGVHLRQMLDNEVNLIVGDPRRLQQVVGNLLSNAIKFTPAGGNVEIRLEQVDSTARIIVSDTGTGIPAEYLPVIFDRFRQVDSSRTRRYGGLGLGLAIVRHLVELHGGTVEAYSAGEGEGAIFTVSLPCRVPDGDVQGNEQGTPAEWNQERDTLALAGLRILIVDDDADSREAISTMVAFQGAEVRPVASVSEALTLLNVWIPDVLVSDLGMPDEDGYDLIRQVRDRGTAEGWTVPAIAVTGYASPEEAERARSAGFHIHLAKPFESARLIDAILRCRPLPSVDAGDESDVLHKP
jgi:PAS domain S-box-containing protein